MAKLTKNQYRRGSRNSFAAHGVLDDAQLAYKCEFDGGILNGEDNDQYLFILELKSDFECRRSWRNHATQIFGGMCVAKTRIALLGSAYGFSILFAHEDDGVVVVDKTSTPDNLRDAIALCIVLGTQYRIYYMLSFDPKLYSCNIHF